MSMFQPKKKKIGQHQGFGASGQLKKKGVEPSPLLLSTHSFPFLLQLLHLQSSEKQQDFGLINLGLTLSSSPLG